MTLYRRQLSDVLEILHLYDIIIIMKRKKDRNTPKCQETLLIDEVLSIHRKKGNGVIKRQVWINNKGEITRYSLAYVNYQLFSGDNGRVLGYDNAHGYHHKHYMGKVESITFHNFQKLESEFQKEFEVLYEKAKNER